MQRCAQLGRAACHQVSDLCYFFKFTTTSVSPNCHLFVRTASVFFNNLYVINLTRFAPLALNTIYEENPVDCQRLAKLQGMFLLRFG